MIDIKTLERQPGDLNFHSQNFMGSNSITSVNKPSEENLTETTQSLSIISQNIEKIQIQDLIAFYDQLDRNLFDDDFQKNQYIFSEKDHFSDISQIINQRLCLAQTKSSIIYAGLQLQPFKLIAIKIQIFFNQYEHILQKLEEYRIHNRINKFFPNQSLQLITPVQISKKRQKFILAACMERGECNLYDYSRKVRITQQQAYSIFEQILIQLLNLHSIKIAHRDVKPQNIFYVKEKGWLLSDFGESQEYDQVESKYNLRGTLYFFMPYLKQSISKSRLVEQNLLANDIYALVITLIVIQSVDYVSDIKNEVKNLKFPQYQQCLKVQNYQELVLFVQNMNQQLQVPFKFDQEFYHQNNSCNNDSVNILSLLQIYQNRQLFKLENLCQDQLFELIKNQQKRAKYINPLIYRRLLQYQLIQNDSKIKNPHLSFSNLTQASLDWQLVVLDELFTKGYIEKTILYSQKLLKQQYDQYVHLKLIIGLYAAEVFSEAALQLKSFNQGLMFDQLETDLKKTYFCILDFENEQQQNKIKENQMQSIYKQKQQELLCQISQTLENQQLKVKDLDRCQVLIIGIKHQLRQFSPANNTIIELIDSIVKEDSINIHEQMKINLIDLKNETINVVTRSELLTDLGRLYILQDKPLQTYQIYQKYKQFLFNSESIYQTITFQIQIIQLKVFELQYKNTLSIKLLNQSIVKLKRLLQKFQNCQIRIYRRHTLNNLGILIESLIISDLTYINPSLFFIIYQFLFNCTDIKFKEEQLIYSQNLAQLILIKLRNYNRCQIMLNQYQHMFQFKSLLQNYQLNQKVFALRFQDTYILEQEMKTKNQVLQFIYHQYVYR